MQKAKLGISVGLLGAAVCFAAIFGGYTAVVLIAGYILLMEENDWLRRTAVKAAVLMVFFGFLLTLIGLIPDLMSWISSIVDVFDGDFNYSIVNAIVSVFTKAIDMIRTCLFLLLGAKALNQKTIAVPFVDSILNVYM